MTREELVQLRVRIVAATGRDHHIDNCLSILTTGSIPRHAVPYTASIDAAMTLVPEEFKNFWTCGDESEAFKLFARYGYNDEVTAATIPLALCLARVEYEISKMETTE